MKKTSKTRLTRWLSCIVTLSLCFGSLGIAAAPSKAEPELSAQGFPLLEAEALPETVRELIGLKADATQKVVQTDNPYEIQTENADGSGQGTLFAAPVKYVDEDGQIRFIDSSIVRKGFFRSLFQSYTYTNAANSVQVEYSPESAKGVRLNGGVIMAVADTKQPDDMPGFVREEAGKDDVFVYPQAFGPDTYVEYSNTAGGVKENIVLEKNVGRNEFAFTLETATHTPVLSADNTSITLVSKTNPGEGDYLISSLYVYDSYQPDGTETAEDFRHYTEDCLYRLEAVEESVYKITAVVSQAFLNHPETVYPVVIDPTVSGTASTMDDAFISPTVTGASNYKASYLRVGKNGNDHYAYLRFGNLPSKPANVDVSSATLKLTYRPNQTTGGVLDCYYVGSSWVGKDLTWNNQPSQYAPGSTYDPQGRNYSIASFDVATHLQNWTNGGYNNYGLCISYNNLSMNDYNSVYSSDGPAASVPRIEYSYTGAYGETSGISSGTIYFLRNVRSGKYMDVQGGGTNVVQYSFHGDANQQWRIIYNGNGYYSLIPMIKQGYRLDVANANDINGTNIGVYQNNGSNAQQFRIIPCSGGCYRLQPKVSTRKVLDVSGASSADSANVQIWDYGPARQHEWYIEGAKSKWSGISRTFSSFSIGNDDLQAYNVFNNALRSTTKNGIRYKPIMNFTYKMGTIDKSILFDYLRYSDIAWIDSHSASSVSIEMRAENLDKPYNHINSSDITSSTFNVKTKWLFLFACSQLNYGDGINTASVWANALRGTSNKLHGILGFYNSAPEKTSAYEKFKPFMDLQTSSVANQTILQSWIEANHTITQKSNWAALVNGKNLNDKLYAPWTADDTNFQYNILYYSRKNPDNPYQFSSRSPVSAVPSSGVVCESTLTANQNFTLNSKPFTEYQKDFISHKLSKSPGSQLEFTDNGGLNYARSSSFNTNFTLKSMNENDVVNYSFDTLSDLKLMPDANFLLELNAIQKQEFIPETGEFSKPEITGYIVDIFHTVGGIPIISDDKEGIQIIVDDQGVVSIKYLWSQVENAKTIQNNQTFKKTEDILNAYTINKKPYPSQKHPIYYRPVYVYQNNKSQPAWAFGEDSSFVNPTYINKATGTTIQME